MKNLLLLAALMPFFVSSALAAPMKPEEVPAPLKPWISWALKGHEAELCPGLNKASAEKQCAWASVLTLTLEKTGGRFTQSWQMYADSTRAFLPGDDKAWPQSVQVDGKPVPVLANGNIPSVLLSKGRHTVTGSFRWNALPEALSVPQATGLIALTLDGKNIPFPEREEQGKLWINRPPAIEKTTENKLELSVYRRLTDSVPQTLTTRLRLKVSGQARELLLGKSLPPGFAAMDIKSILPVRLEQDNRVKIQVRPGIWEISIGARHEGPADAITLNTPDGQWGDGEIWVFEARNELRSASVEGVPPMDPQQTELPAEWRSLPAYFVTPGKTVKIIQHKRGDEGRPADDLSISRTLWLDFDGRGLTAADSISGSVSRSARIEAERDTMPGRAIIAGKDQLITEIKKGSRPGVEVRPGNLAMTAYSRIEADPRNFTATGWAHPFNHASASLRLPPGWRLLHVSGADKAYPTWVSRWTFLDFFLLVVAVLATASLFGPRLAALAAAALALAWHEPAMPHWPWLFLLGTEAILRTLSKAAGPSEKVLSAARSLRMAAAGFLFLCLLPFFYGQILNFHPQFDRRMDRVGTVSAHGNFESLAQDEYGLTKPSLEAELEAMKEAQADRMEDAATEFMRKRRGSLGGAISSGAARAVSASAKAMPGYGTLGSSAYSREEEKVSAKKTAFTPDPDSRITTGPGIPQWDWRHAAISWSGPIPSGRSIHLWLLSPGGNMALSVIRILLAAALALLLYGAPLGAWLNRLKPRRKEAAAATTLLLFASLLAGMPGLCRAQMPSSEILEQLRAKLMEQPACGNECGTLTSLHLAATQDTLKITLEAGAAAQTAIPLPCGQKQWLPSRITVDGETAAGFLSRHGQLWLVLTPGIHRIVLEGRLPDKETVQLPLPLRPRHATAEASGWVVSGIRENGLPDESLQLSRSKGATASREQPLKQEALSPFLQVERTLELGLSWQVRTHVRRLTPPGNPLLADIPLLPGEAVTSPGANVENGMLHVNMPPQAMEFEWESTLEQKDKLTLTAPPQTRWTEVWRLNASPLWHTETTGLPALLKMDETEDVKEWHPWPGESLTIGITRPKGIQGRTFTIYAAELETRPGKNSAADELNLRYLSSMGGQHTITLPPDVEVRKVQQDGMNQAIEQNGRKLSFTLMPGKHGVKIEWLDKRGISAIWRTPEVDLGMPSSNLRIKVTLPPGRWILSLGGPSLGPAVLFWSVLAVLLVASLGLARLRLTPQSASEWLTLSIGLTQASLPAAAFIMLWFLILGWRRDHMPQTRWRYNLVQLTLLALTAIALSAFLSALKNGLLGYPGMFIAGNNSDSGWLYWYQDRAAGMLPGAWILSLPLVAYRLAMLVWALWLAKSLLNWSRWGWSCWTAGGIWRSKPAADSQTGQK